MKRIIVTGATGSVGTAVVRKALENGYDVTCLVHRGSHRLGNLPKSDRVTIVEADVAEYATLVLDGKYESFIHLSWEKTFGAKRDDVDIQDRNIGYTLEACRLAKRCGCKSFVGAGSQAEFGVTNQVLKGDMPVNPESGYGIAKYAAGKLAAMLCSQIGIRFNWIRIVSVYGPNDGENSFISYLIRELKAGNEPNVTKCEQIWDYLYSDDAGEAFIAVAERGYDGRTYVIGSGVGRPMSEYVDDIKSVVNPTIKVNYGAIDYYPHQPMHLVAYIEDLKEDTGWIPKTKFSEGIKQITEWYN